MWYTRRKDKEPNAMEPSESILTEPRDTKTLPVISEHIVSTDDTCGGAPRIAGSRIRVKDVVIWHIHQRMSLDEIVMKWPHLTDAGVHAALAYYYDHKDEIEAEIEKDLAWYEEMKSKTPSLVQEKLAKMRNRVEFI
jgi:uncharacterized protein (DUF433 family)